MNNMFAEKIASLMAKPGQPDLGAPSDIPWHMKYGSRLLGIVGAFFAILFGFYNCLSILLLSISCFISGVLQIIAGIIVMALEAPCCFICLEKVTQIADMADQRPMWNRAALYCAIALPPVILCPGLGSLFGCGLLFGTGVLYGMMGLGKNTTTEEMRNNTAQPNFAPQPPPPTNDRASIVNNAQPFSFTGAVGTDSNV